MAKRCAVKVEAINNRLRLRWSASGKRYCLALGLYDSDLAQTIAQQRAKQIEADLITGNFDATLRKYNGAVDEAAADTSITVVQLFHRFTSQRLKGNSGRTVEKYHALQNKLEQFFSTATVATVDDDSAERFRVWLGQDLQPITQAQQLSLLTGCWVWGMGQDLVDQNPWADVVRRVKVPPRQRPRPFTTEEINAILSGFSSSRYYRYYADYVTFLFGTGCRTGEAIGLRWAHLADDCGKVWIGESVTRGVRKATKTNQSREFRLSKHLVTLLQRRKPEPHQPDDLVFPARKGGPIDDHNFRNRAWVSILEQVGVPYRKSLQHSAYVYFACLSAGHEPDGGGTNDRA